MQVCLPNDEDQSAPSSSRDLLAVQFLNAMAPGPNADLPMLLRLSMRASCTNLSITSTPSSLMGPLIYRLRNPQPAPRTAQIDHHHVRLMPQIGDTAAVRPLSGYNWVAGPSSPSPSSWDAASEGSTSDEADDMPPLEPVDVASPTLSHVDTSARISTSDDREALDQTSPTAAVQQGASDDNDIPTMFPVEEPMPTILSLIPITTPSNSSADCAALLSELTLTILYCSSVAGTAEESRASEDLARVTQRCLEFVLARNSRCP